MTNQTASTYTHTLSYDDTRGYHRQEIYESLEAALLMAAIYELEEFDLGTL